MWPNITIQCMYLSAIRFALALKKWNLTLIFNSLEKLKMNYQISIISIYKKNKTSIWYQFSISMEKINWNSDANFHISIFPFRQPVFISSLRFLLLSQRKPGMNKDRKVMKTIHSEFKGKCSLIFFGHRPSLYWRKIRFCSPYKFV